MANQVLVAAGGNLSAAASWESIFGAGDATGPPANGDDVSLVVGSGALVVDVNSNALGSFTAETHGNTMTVDAEKTLHIDGTTILGGTTVLNGAIDVDGDLQDNSTLTGAGTVSVSGSFQANAMMDHSAFTGTITQDGTNGTPTILYNTLTIGPFVVNNNGVTSFIAQDARSGMGFLLTAGKYSDGGFATTEAGSIVRDGGTLTSTGTWTQNATGNVRQAASAAPFGDLVLGKATGATTHTLTGHVYTKKLETEASATISDGGNARILSIFEPGANDALATHADTTWSMSTAGSRLELRLVGNRELTSGNGPVDIGDTRFRFDSRGGSRTLTISNDFTCGLFETYSNQADPVVATVVFNGGDLSCTGMDLVYTAGHLAAFSMGSGTHTITDDIEASDGSATLDFENSDTDMGGNTIEGANISAVTGQHPNDGAVAVIRNATIQNVTVPAGLNHLDCTDRCVDGGGNTGSIWWPGTDGIHSMPGSGGAGRAPSR